MAWKNDDQPKRPLPRAVALKYEPGIDNVPLVVAAGQGEVALQILRIAQEHGVEIVENEPVVKALVRLDPGQEIPVELYRAVAEILAFVYRLKGQPDAKAR